MRKNILKAIAERLSGQVPEVKFIDLWNDQLSVLPTGASWPLPAVFVEFEQIDWHQMANHARTADVGVQLHVITRTVKYNGVFDRRAVKTIRPDSTRIDAALYHLDLLDRVNAAMQSLSGENFASFMHTASMPGLNHGELTENVERFVTRTCDMTAVRTAAVAKDVSVVTIEDILDRI